MNDPHFLHGSRVYLSGPMDFVASRADEKRLGWRNRIGEFLKAMGATVFDPWFKPGVRGLHQYGEEDEKTVDVRNEWTFEQTTDGADARAKCAAQFRETMHIDLRMVDTSDFTIAYCPTNIYSVGTPHEIVVCRQQHKPVLFVSPPVEFRTLDSLREHLEGDEEGLKLLERLQHEVPIKSNPRGIPSLWYMPLVGSHSFFDGFGFAKYRERFGWARIPMDEHEERVVPVNPLLPFLEKLSTELPQIWDSKLRKFVPNDDWLLWDLPRSREVGDQVKDVHVSGEWTPFFGSGEL